LPLTKDARRLLLSRCVQKKSSLILHWQKALEIKRGAPDSKNAFAIRAKVLICARCSCLVSSILRCAHFSEPDDSFAKQKMFAAAALAPGE
jgi:hypothetical protein